MKWKLAASLAATVTAGTVCTLAANPFVDVPADNWAYGSIVQLADAGIVQGIDGSYFQGDRAITRYEAAEMTAKAMAHMDKASVEQRALINKLADEFAAELNSLGVRVQNLEDRVGNVRLSGDFRVRYMHQNDFYSQKKNNDDDVDFRARIRANAKVNDKTAVEFGLSTYNIDFDDQGAASSTDQTYVDLANVRYTFSPSLSLLAGRYTYVMGQGMYLQYTEAFDGAQLKYSNRHWSLTGGYGKFKEGGITGAKAGFAALDTTFDHGSFGIYADHFNGALVSGHTANTIPGDVGYHGGWSGHNIDNIYGAYANVTFGGHDAWKWTGDYQRITKATEYEHDKNGNLWGTKLQYGNALMPVSNSWDIWLEYINGDENTYVGAPNFWRNPNLRNNVTSWGAGIDYTISKNLMFSIMQSFASRAKEGPTDPTEETRCQFVCVF
ncbi:MAG: S-layer homology domain-containing protein [Megasphaera sp.]|nr:S-layer homology domain-containing protein [Megasphaera sp.]MCH4187979.1 S-layer homology domain-containing protein [Megasphaera sp.]MCH4217699.1 S-layer homology domain-containing protein [Megasphaera sp.]